MTTSSKPSKAATALAWCGLLWLSVVVFFAIVLPFLWSPLLKTLFLYKSKGFVRMLAAGAILSPFMIVGGFSWMAHRGTKETLLQLQKTLGLELLLVGSLWFIVDLFRLTQAGWTAMQPGPQFIFGFKAFIWCPGMLGVGFALFTQDSWRNIFGISLTTLAYQSFLGLGLYRLFLSVARQFVPMLAPAPKSALIQQTTMTLLITGCVAFVLGLLLMKGTLRWRAQLLFAFPVWLPFFVVFFFWSLVVDTTFYFFEDLLGIQLHPPRVVKFLSAPFCLVLFPLLLTIDFSIGLMRLLGHHLLTQLFPVEEQSPELLERVYSNQNVYGLGALLLLTLPIWALPVLFYGSIRLFVYESILTHVARKKSTN